jgi:hypothetical protein
VLCSGETVPVSDQVDLLLTAVSHSLIDCASVRL